MVRSGLAKGGGVLAAAGLGILMAGALGSALDEAARSPARPEPAVEAPPEPPREDTIRYSARAMAVAAPAPSDRDRLPPRPRRNGPEEPEASAEPPGAPDPDLVRLRPPITVEDGPILRSGSLAIRLVGIEMPPAGAVCLDGARRLWACGSRAGAAIRNLAGSGEIVCRLQAPGNDPPDATCEVFGSDLARSLVQLGFAKPVAGAGAQLDRAGAEARRAGRGLWSGGWTMR